MLDSSSFGMVRNVLDDLLSEVYSGTWVDVIRCELKNLSDGYRGLSYGGSVNYRKIKTCFAYLYCYMAAHANAVYMRIRYTPALRDLFNKPSVHVSCLGGGPGSDFLGILKFMASCGVQTELTCYTYDKETRWKAVWDCLLSILYPSLTLPDDYQFRTFDVTETRDWKKYPDLEQSDLFTMIFFLSELLSKKEQAEHFFLDLFKRAKSGAFFLFVDNHFGGSEKWFDDMIAAHNTSYHVYQPGYIICENLRDNIMLHLESDEQVVDLGPYYQRLRRPGEQHAAEPRQRLRVNFRICHKL